MLGGQNEMIDDRLQKHMNPENIVEKQEIRVDAKQNQMVQSLFKTFKPQVQQNHIVPQNSNQQSINKQHEMDIQCYGNQIQPENEQQRQSPIDQSYSNSNNSKGRRNKPVPLSNQLIRLTKKSTTTNCKREKKVRYYVTDFEPYLPTFLDQMHREHSKTIIRVGQQYQAQIDPHPKFQSIYRPMGHLRVWKGVDEPFDEEVYRKFKQIFGDYRTEEELILLKSRLKADKWADVMKQLNEQKQQGKKPTLHIPNNHMNGTSTRIK